MTLHRRALLGSLGVASATSLLWAFGCGAPPRPRRSPQISRDVRSWLHSAVASLAAIYPSVHALAVSRQRTTAALDVLGPGIAHLRRDAAILTVRRRDGSRREYLTSELSAAGIAAAARALDAPERRAAIDFGPAPAAPSEPPALDPAELHHRLDRLLASDARRSSRIVYAAALLDIDDAVVWSVAPGRDLEQRVVRIRQTATRAAWTATRPIAAEVERAWSGSLGDQALDDADIAGAGDAALRLMTPGSFPDGERTVLLDPSVAALALDAAVRGLLTSAVAQRPEVAARVPLGAPLASPAITLIDDPTAPGAYGGFSFDDEGEPAAPLTLLAAGQLAARLSDRAGGNPGRGRRPGHVGCVEPQPSHLLLIPGTASLPQLYSDGLVLEAGLTASYDPATDHLRIACGRARELRAGSTTGRIYADVELVGSLTPLLSAIDAVARQPSSFAPPNPADAEPHWRSIATPALRTRGTVRARRSRP